MNYSRFSEKKLSMVASADADSGEQAQEPARMRVERSRKTLLMGWIVSMIGIVAYCFAMSGGDPSTDLLGGHGLDGLIGWGTIAVIFIGIAIWLVGCIGFLNDSDCLAAETGEKS